MHHNSTIKHNNYERKLLPDISQLPSGNLLHCWGGENSRTNPYYPVLASLRMRSELIREFSPLAVQWVPAWELANEKCQC